MFTGEEASLSRFGANLRNLYGRTKEYFTLAAANAQLNQRITTVMPGTATPAATTRIGNDQNHRSAAGAVDRARDRDTIAATAHNIAAPPSTRLARSLQALPSTSTLPPPGWSWHDVYQESFIANPREEIVRLCKFLHLECSEAYLTATVNIVSSTASDPSTAIVWPQDVVAAIRRCMQSGSGAASGLDRYVDHVVALAPPAMAMHQNKLNALC